MNIDTTFPRSCIQTLETALVEIEKQQVSNDIFCDIYRAACVKEFELVLEQSGKLLRKRLAACFAASCGGAPLDIIRRHVEEQRTIGNPR